MRHRKQNYLAQTIWFSSLHSTDQQFFTMTMKYFKLLKTTCLRPVCLLTIHKAFERGYMILLKKLQLYSIRVNMEPKHEQE